MDSDACDSDIGPDSARSLPELLRGNDATGTPTPTRDATMPQMHRSEWWHLHTDMEGVTLGGSPSTGGTVHYGPT